MSIGRALRVDWALQGAAMMALAIGFALVGEAVWIHGKAQAAQLLIGAAWHRGRALSRTASPWPWADTRPIAELTWGAGSSASTFMVLEGSSGRNLAFGPVHDAASVVPGRLGNSVIEGHRDTHFKILRGAALGDHLSIGALDGSQTQFVVTDVRVVDSRRTRIVLDADNARLTLVTCYPFDALVPGGPLRWVVTADAVNPVAAVAEPAGRTRQRLSVPTLGERIGAEHVPAGF